MAPWLGGLLFDEVRGRVSESMGHELAPLGIQVTAIEPGGFRTNFLDDSSFVTAQATIEDYTTTAGATRQWAKQTNYAQAGDPVKAAKVIVDLAGRKSLPERISSARTASRPSPRSSRAPHVIRPTGGRSRPLPVTTPDGHDHTTPAGRPCRELRRGATCSP